MVAHIDNRHTAPIRPDSSGVTHGDLVSATGRSLGGMTTRPVFAMRFRGLAPTDRSLGRSLGSGGTGDAAAEREALDAVLGRAVDLAADDDAVADAVGDLGRAWLLDVYADWLRRVVDDLHV